ncbi:MAG: hypothetical protein PHW79_07815, partial [Candidatus Marinimicrobia bacterium]|nr:hypothetical protein [Candidatus Neomarinimicrobiota bacterium]
MIKFNFFKNGLMILLLSVSALSQQNQEISDRHLARENFKSKYGTEWNIRWNSKTETPSSITGGKITKYNGSPLDIARAFLDEEKTLFVIKNVENELILTKENISKNGGNRYIFSQVFNGVPII